MPSNLVKTKRDERLWNEAKDRADEQGRAKDWAYITGIFERMKGERKASTPAQARAKFVMRGAASEGKLNGSVWISIEDLQPDEKSLILRAEPVIDKGNQIVPYGVWKRALSHPPYLYPDNHEGISDSDKGVWIPEENIERAASRLRDPIDREADLQPPAAFVIPYRFAPVRVGPTDPGAAKKRQDEHPLVGTVRFQGLLIDLENLQGSYREGPGWRNFMHHHYGEFRNSIGVDGDPLDVYVGPNALSPLAVVIHQHDPKTGQYDEDKVMVGFDTERDAIQAYLGQYDRPGFYVEGQHRTLPVPALAAWMYRPGNRGRVVRAGAQHQNTKMAGPFGPSRVDAHPPLKKLGGLGPEIFFYGILADDRAVQDLGVGKLNALSSDLAKIVRENTDVDWQRRDSVRARLRNLIRGTLRRYQYPSDNQEKVVDSVLKQAELFFPRP